MDALFQHVNYWTWWILAVALFVLEAFAPGTFFLWMGISAGLVGLLVFIVPDMGWDYQIFIFSTLSVVSITEFLEGPGSTASAVSFGSIFR